MGLHTIRLSTASLIAWDKYDGVIIAAAKVDTPCREACAGKCHKTAAHAQQPRASLPRYTKTFWKAHDTHANNTVTEAATGQSEKLKEFTPCC